jgi:hypothetical protein
VTNAVLDGFRTGQCGRTMLLEIMATYRWRVELARSCRLLPTMRIALKEERSRSRSNQ